MKTSLLKAGEFVVVIRAPKPEEDPQKKFTNKNLVGKIGEVMQKVYSDTDVGENYVPVHFTYRVNYCGTPGVAGTWNFIPARILRKATKAELQRYKMSPQ